MTIELLYTEPFRTTIHTRTITTPIEVEQAAAARLARYQAEQDILPGIDLRRGDDGESLSIAIAPFGWALVATDSAFDQHCTRCPDTTDHTAQRVRWEEPDSVPSNWFVRQQDALQGVSRWMTDGTLDPGLSWSDQGL
jgi:hypothetical protein